MTPGEVLQAELDRRGWTHEDLAMIVGRHRPDISNVVANKRAITPELAVAFAAALGNTPEYWLALETKRKLAQVADDTDEVRRRAQIYQLAPVKEMQRRGWIAKTTDAAELSDELCRFFEVTSLNESPTIAVAARKTDRESGLSPEQLCWCTRARQIARALVVPPYDPARLPVTERKLRKAAAYLKESINAAEILREAGIRFVVVEPLPSGKIDGAAFWLDEISPVIALSIRFDRIDAFWFTLMHEFAHIKHCDVLSVDDDVAGTDAVPSRMKSEMECRADEEAQSILLPRDELESFVLRTRPLYSKDRIIQFAHRVKMHPGVIVGQLQHRGEIGYHANREMLAKVRDLVTSTAVTDGWGKTIAPGTL